MSDIRKITVGVGAEFKDLDVQLGRAFARVQDFAKRVESKVGAISPAMPEASQATMPTGGNPGGGGMADSASSIGGEIQGAFAGAMGPLDAFVKRFQADFDKVGGTVVELAKRIDSSMKFAGVQSAIGKVGDLVKARFSGMAEDAEKFGARVDRAVNATRTAHKVADALGSMGSVAGKSLSSITGGGAGARASLLTVSGAATAATGQLRGMGVQALLAFGAFGLVFKAITRVKDSIVGGVKDASDLNETLSKTDAVLGSASTGVKAFADDLAGRFGLIKGDTLDIASGLGGLFKGLGKLDGAKLEGLTKQFTMLSADLSSFANVDMKEAGKAIQVGLAGNQSDVLKSLGVVLTETTLKTYALAHGIGTAGGELTESQKVMARAGVIAKSLADASGDLEKTAGGAANQWRKFTGNASNAATALGTTLLPAINKGIGFLNDLGASIGEAFAGSNVVGDFAARLSEGFDLAGAAVRNWGATTQLIGLSVGQQFNNVEAVFTALGQNIGQVVEFIKTNWLNMLKDVGNAFIAFGNNYSANFRKLGLAAVEFLKDPTKGFTVDFTPMLDGFKAATAKFPDLIRPVFSDLSGQMGGLASRILDDLGKRTAKAKADAQALKDSAEKKAAVKAPEGRQDLEQLADFSKTLKDKVQTPQAKFLEDMVKINQAAGAGLLTKMQAARGRASAVKDLAGDQKPRFAAAVSANSSEGRSAILAATAGRNDPTLKVSQSIAANTNQTNVLVARLIDQMSKPKPAMSF